MPVNHASTESRPSPADEFFEYDPLERYLSACQQGSIRLCGHAVTGKGITMLLEIQSPPGVPSIMYPLGPYEMVAEFRRMLSYPFRSKPGADWDGQYFYAFRHSDGQDRIYWRGRSHGITICVTTEQWRHIRTVFDEAFSRPEYARVWIRLTAQHGRR